MARTVMIVMVGALALFWAASPRAMSVEEKDALGLLYAVQMAPKACGWNDAGASANIDAKVKQAEATSTITPAEKAELQTAAAADLKKPGACEQNGFARYLYDETAAGR